MALIMVADDDRTQILILTKFLESRGHQVVSVMDGMETAMKAQEWRPHLIVSDIQMPNAYGTTAYEVYRKDPNIARTPVIFITGVPIESAKKILPADPLVRLMSKPIDFKQLEAWIAELLPGGKPAA